MSIASRTINHALFREQWARTRLAAFAGTTFAVIAGPARTACIIKPDGTVDESDQAAALTLTIAPHDVPTLLAQPARWGEFVVAQGDASLAATLAELALTLPWFVERELAALLGPIIGTRVADAGRAILSAPAYATERLADSTARYVRDEAKLVAGKADAHDFATSVADIERRLDALSARVDRLDRTADNT